MIGPEAHKDYWIFHQIVSVELVTFVPLMTELGTRDSERIFLGGFYPRRVSGAATYPLLPNGCRNWWHQLRANRSLGTCIPLVLLEYGIVLVLRSTKVTYATHGL